MKGDFYDSDEVTNIIESYCQAHNINEADFAELVGIHPTSLSRIKAGKHCSPENLQKIAALGKKDLSDLVRAVPDNVKQAIQLSGANNNLPACV